MPRRPWKKLLIPAVILPLAAAGFVAATQVAASAAANPGPGFPAHFAAPYAEMWNSPSTLMTAVNATGNKYFTLAFVISQGTCNATINGDTAITDAGWNGAINSVRAAGGDVIASFGGASGTELTSCSTVATMQAQYKRVIDQLNLTMIDLDIEGATLNNTAANDRRNTALANLQVQYAAAGRNLKVNYTLPVNPTGLESNSISLLNNAKSHNLNVNVVNIMTMDYGPAMDMGQAAIQAANALRNQLGAIWNTKTNAQLWAMEGNTPMVGVNDTAAEIFNTQDATELTNFARTQGIQLLAYWALGRDNQGSSGTPQSQYQFVNTFKAITGGTVPPTTPPTTPPAGTQHVEAETGTSSAGATIDSNHLGFTGSGFVNTANATGATLDVSVNRATAGNAQLTVRFGNGTTVARPMSVTVNGAAAGSLPFPSTVAWTTWTTSGAVTVPLRAGANTIRFTATTVNGGPNLDWVEVR